MSEAAGIREELKDTAQGAIRALHETIRAAVRSQLTVHAGDALAEAPVQGHGDLSYRLDLHAEEIIDRFFRSEWRGGPVTVVSEGTGTRTYPDGAKSGEARYRIIIDPLDGTRELMYDKRSAWVLTGVALNRGDTTTLSDILYALQTEVPPSKQGVGSVLWAFKGEGAVHELWQVDGSPALRGQRPLRPSQATNLQNGYAVFTDFFSPGPRLATAHLSQRVLEEVSRLRGGDLDAVFSDQYISNAGQLYLLATGAYRFVADLRPVLQRGAPGGALRGPCSHPYDLCTSLIATEAGAIVTDEHGEGLRYPLDTDTDCAWVGYANDAIRSLMEPPLRRALAAAPL